MRAVASGNILTPVVRTSETEFNRPLENRRVPSVNYYKFVRWNSRGTLLLSVNNDHHSRIYSPYSFSQSATEGGSLPEWTALLCTPEYEPIRDACWHPIPQRENDAANEFYAVSKCSLPLVIKSASTGEVVKSFSTVDHRDAYSAPNCLTFSPDGSRLLAGLCGRIAVYDVENSCEQRTEYQLSSCSRRRASASERIDKRLSGVVSSMSFSPANPRLLLASTFKNGVGIFDTSNWPSMETELVVTDWKRDSSALLYGTPLESASGKTRVTAERATPSATVVCNLSGPSFRGITQASWLPDGNTIVLTGRGKAWPILKAFDLRMPDRALFLLDKLNADESISVNQRLHFDVQCGRYLTSGTVDGYVVIFDLAAAIKVEQRGRVTPTIKETVSTDTVTSATLHPFFHHDSGHYRYLAVSTGSRNSLYSNSATTKKGEALLGLYSVGAIPGENG